MAASITGTLRNTGRWRVRSDDPLYMGHIEETRGTGGRVDPGTVHRGKRGARIADRARVAERREADRKAAKRKTRHRNR